MGVLPTNRVNIGAPFRSSGVDMAGPIPVKMNGRATHKIYIALFTCMSTRAVHLELVYKIDAEEFINALRRFTARRPGVVEIISDNGTNFVAADRILKGEMKKWREETKTTLGARGIDWKWIPVAECGRGW